jgi:hypothetical protein
MPNTDTLRGIIKPKCPLEEISRRGYDCVVLTVLELKNATGKNA